MNGTYVIQLTQNPNLCIEAQHQMLPGQAVTLQNQIGTGSPYQRWVIDDTGVIRSLLNPQLVIDFQGDPCNGAQIILSAFKIQEPSQQWSYNGYNQLISLGYPQYAIDDRGTPYPGDTLHLWQQDPNILNQLWTLVEVSSTRAAV